METNPPNTSDGDSLMSIDAGRGAVAVSQARRRPTTLAQKATARVAVLIQRKRAVRDSADRQPFVTMAPG